ncbi:hypothetical protein [Pantoea phytobeneficialis]|uniref:Uncharacterized protein n=1 Tax=Pantoea phytobeneficialis TaxID=2052056 RepID=A0AAP9H3V1_9GAMM|nr:hypothetical protein [Pantoea phytobeneficialis]MDO6406249.1 hypothetical protein [Pantoea phytobeneficialis]QGR06255.1 hypothetical protein CTZ24_07490 [Pantoea phytobeneficialis]
MTIQVRVWYTQADGSIAGPMPVEKNYDVDLSSATTTEERFDMVSNAVSEDTELTEKTNVTWQLVS